MKSVEFLIDTRLQAKKLVIFTPKKGGSTWSCIIFTNKIFIPNYILSKCSRNFLSKNTYCCMVQVKSYSMITDEIGKFCRPNLFSVPVKNIENLDF